METVLALVAEKTYSVPQLKDLHLRYVGDKGGNRTKWELIERLVVFDTSRFIIRVRFDTLPDTEHERYFGAGAGGERGGSPPGRADLELLYYLAFGSDGSTKTDLELLYALLDPNRMLQPSFCSLEGPDGDGLGWIVRLGAKPLKAICDEMGVSKYGISKDASALALKIRIDGRILPKSALKEACRAMGLKVGGNVGELEDRLKKKVGFEETSSGDKESDEEESEGEESEGKEREEEESEEEEEEEGPQCPMGWAIHYSTTMKPGQPYYERISDGHVQWELPKESLLGRVASAMSWALGRWAKPKEGEEEEGEEEEEEEEGEEKEGEEKEGEEVHSKGTEDAAAGSSEQQGWLVPLGVAPLKAMCDTMKISCCGVATDASALADLVYGAGGPTKSALKEACRAMGLKLGGNVGELEDRLKAKIGGAVEATVLSQRAQDKQPAAKRQRTETKSEPKTEAKTAKTEAKTEVPPPISHDAAMQKLEEELERVKQELENAKSKKSGYDDLDPKLDGLNDVQKEVVLQQQSTLRATLSAFGKSNAQNKLLEDENAMLRTELANKSSLLHAAKERAKQLEDGKGIAMPPAGIEPRLKSELTKFSGYMKKSVYQKQLEKLGLITLQRGAPSEGQHVFHIIAVANGGPDHVSASEHTTCDMHIHVP